MVGLCRNNAQKVVFTPELPGIYEFKSPEFPSLVLKLDVGPCPAEASCSNSVEVTSDSMETGRQIYQAVCASRHVATGKGDGPAIPGLARKPIDSSKPYTANIRDEEMFAIITDGWYGMSAFEGVPPEHGRWHVINYINYIRTLSKNPSS